MRSTGIQVFLIVLLAVMVFPCGSVSRSDMFKGTCLHIDEDKLQDGDLIFRRGVSLASHFVLSVDSTSVFSHVGIVRVRDGHAHVIHILPEEDRSEKDEVRMDPVGIFLSPDNASGYAVYRMSGNRREIPERAADMALTLLKSRVQYDYDLDCTTRKKMYCTELVWSVYRMSGIDLIDGRLEKAGFPFYNGEYIMISSLLKSRWLDKIQ